MNKQYHLIVIGAGSGGLVAAAGAAGLGAKVALVERHKMGGDCLNTGCVPSKAIIRTAKLLYDLKTADRFGLNLDSPSPHPLPRGEGVGGRVTSPIPVELSKIMESVREVQKKIEPHDSPDRFRELGVDVHFGSFRFISPHEITDGTVTLSATRFVIATGASPFIPPIKGIKEAPILTSDNVWGLTEVPQRLVVLGGGPIGAELTQVFARLGSRVSVVDMAECLLPREDSEASCLIKDHFEREGIEVLVNTRAVEVLKAATGYELVVSRSTLPLAPSPQGRGDIQRVIPSPLRGEGKGGGEGVKRIPFDQILVAVGRSPNVNELNLEKAGIIFSKKGIEVDDYLRTSTKHIFACGDVVGPYQFTHTADFQARLILRNALFPGKAKIDYRVVPWCTFTDPEVARVGLNEKEAKEKGIAYNTYSYSMKDLDRAVCDREDGGFIKVLTEKGSDQLLGITIVGSHAGDLLHELALAMHQRTGLKKVASMIHVYPTLAEISKRIADTYQRTRLTPRSKRWLERYFRWRFR